MSMPLHKDLPMSEWDADAKRLGVESGEILRAQTMLADEIIADIIAEEAAEELGLSTAQVLCLRLAVEGECTVGPVVDALIGEGLIHNSGVITNAGERIVDKLCIEISWRTARQEGA